MLCHEGMDRIKWQISREDLLVLTVNFNHILFIAKFLVCVCIHVPRHTSGSQKTACPLSSLLPSCGTWVSNLSCEIWQQCLYPLSYLTGNFVVFFSLFNYLLKLPCEVVGFMAAFSHTHICHYTLVLFTPSTLPSISCFPRLSVKAIEKTFLRPIGWKWSSHTKNRGWGNIQALLTAHAKTLG